MSELENWCKNNELSCIFQKLQELEFKNLEALVMLDDDDIKELVCELNIKFGKKANFLLAVEKLKKEHATTKEITRTDSTSKLEEFKNFNTNNKSNNNLNNMVVEKNFKGVVSRMNSDNPGTTFELPLQTVEPFIDIHQCVIQGITNERWNILPYKRLYQSIVSHAKNCNEIKDLLVDNSKLNLDILLSLVYYSSDMRPFGGTEEDSIFRLLNQDLFSRDPVRLNKWLPFLYYSLEAFKILPKFRGTVYRGITKKVLETSKLYRQGSEVVWISFTSTSKDHQVMKSFSGSSGTWFVIECEEGIELTFSLFPKESEILLFPNSIFKVAGLITKEMKDLIHSYPENFDLVQLTQVSGLKKIPALPHPQLISSQNLNLNIQNKRETKNCFIFGSKGSGDGQFNQTRGVATDKDGNIYVCDFYNHRIQIFDPNGQFLRKFGSKGNKEGQFDHPRGIAIDNTIENIIVCDCFNYRVQIFDSNGKFTHTFGRKGVEPGTFRFPIGVAVDPTNQNIIVTDFYNGVQEFNQQGEFIRKIGSMGDEDGQIYSPWGIATESNGNVIICDAGNYRIQIFDSSRDFIRKFGTRGLGDGEFDGPSGVATDRDGNIYVCDQNNNRVQQFDNKGKFIRKFGTHGSDTFQFCKPYGIAINNNNRNVIVSDMENNRIQLFS